MADASVQTEHQRQAPVRERPRLYDLDKMRREIEGFILFNEGISMEVSGNKGYIRELFVNDEYTFGVWRVVKALECEVPMMRYYYEILKDKEYTPEIIKEIKGALRGNDFLWPNKIPISKLLEVGNS